MKLQFKHQKFQADAAKAVVDVFAGQPYLTPTYMMDRGTGIFQIGMNEEDDFTGWRNQPLVPELSKRMILEQIQEIQRIYQITPSQKLEGEGYNLTIEMETGVGKTYTYIKTMFELNKHYGWSKFIVVVPSIAIREGVYKSFEVTQEHFAEEYGKKIRFFIYNSAQLTEIDRFASDNSINVMIINSQAFNARGKDARRIYMKLDEFRSRRPIDIIAKTKGIFIKNIYYMLAYAFRILRQKNYDEIAAEEFDDIQDLFAVILAKGVSQQLKQGLHKEYITKNEDLSVMRGKLDIYGTIKNQIQRKKSLSCEYDELSVNNIFNQILKTTMTILIRDSGVKKSHKADLKKIILFFHDIDIIEPSRIRWSSLMYQRNNKNYEMLINICYFVLDGMLQTTDKGNYKMMTFSDEHMHRLYEKFVLEYFKRHHSYLSEVRAAQVKWNLATDTEESMIRFLPAMQTDIFLRYKEKVLIIDTKYYGNSMQKQYDKVTIHSGNMYQIFTYVKNQDVENNGRVSGMLLYAKTEEAITPDCSFVIGGNKISVKTVDLNKEFKLIAAQLDKIAEDYFGKKRIEDSII